jgi:hypothetical protein
MRRLLAALVLFAGLASPAAAQVIDYGSITVQDAGSCATPKACLTFDVPTLTNALTFQVSGTFSGTLTFEATADTGATPVWFSVIATKLSDGSASTTTTGTGQFYVPNTGLLRVRVRGGSFASGTATVYLTRGYSNARLLYPTFTTVTATSGFLAPTGCTTVPYSYTGQTSDGWCSPSSGIVRGGANQVQVPNGSNALPGLAFPIDSTVGFTSGLSGIWDWVTASTVRIRLLSSGLVFSTGGGISATTGNASGTVDARIYRSGTKTWTVDDGAGGAAKEIVIGQRIWDAATTSGFMIKNSSGEAQYRLGDDSASAGTTAKYYRTVAVAFANVPGSPAEGTTVAVTDSTTATWGATITGGGANHVLAYYNGTNWTVAGK